MKVFTCRDFTGFYPVGTAAVVVAEDIGAATVALRNALIDNGLPGDDFTLRELDTERKIHCDFAKRWTISAPAVWEMEEMMKDEDGIEVRAGDWIAFSFGMPPPTR